MRILAFILILLGAATLLAPQLRAHMPIHLADAAWQWMSFGAIAMAALLYFLAPKS